MVKKQYLALLTTALLFTNCSEQQKSDKSIEQKLIGTWHKDLKRGSKVTHVVTKFTHDHRFATYARVKGTNRKLYATGRWRVRFGILNEIILKSNYAKPHTRTYDKILTINYKQFVYKTESGDIFSYYRNR